MATREETRNARSAAYMHIDGMIEDGEFKNLSVSSIAKFKPEPDYDGATWVMVDPAKSANSKLDLMLWPAVSA